MTVQTLVDGNSAIAQKVAGLVFGKMFGYGTGRGEEQQIIIDCIVAGLKEVNPHILKDMFTSDDGVYDLNKLNPVYAPLIEQLATSFLFNSERTQGWFTSMWSGSGIKFTEGFKNNLYGKQVFARFFEGLVNEYAKLSGANKQILDDLCKELSGGLKLKHYWMMIGITNDFVKRCLPYMDEIAHLSVGERKEFMNKVMSIYSKELAAIDTPSQLKDLLDNQKAGNLSSSLDAVFNEFSSQKKLGREQVPPSVKDC